MKYAKKHLSLSIILVLILSLVPVTALANSAQTLWDGTDSTGAIITGENCPIVVEHELLTFDIGEFPASYYRGVSDYLAYSGSVTAAYTFYNPADYDVNATLVFPFGGIPDYGDIWDNENAKPLRYSDTEKYDITVAGVTIAFEQADHGYAVHLDGLPEGELTFTLCSEPVPKIPAFQGGFPTDLLLIAAALLTMLAVVIAAAQSAKKKTH